MFKLYKLAFAAIIGLFSLIGCSSSAAAASLGFDAAGGLVVGCRNIVCGNTITMTTDFQLTELGAFIGMAGAGPALVGLYTDTGTLLVSTSVNQNSTLIDQTWLLEPVSPITLLAGRTYVGAVLSSFPEAYFPGNPLISSQFISNALAGLVTPGWTQCQPFTVCGTDTVLSFPTDNSALAGAAVWNFRGTATSSEDVPEPSSFSFIALGALVATLLRRNRKII